MQEKLAELEKKPLKYKSKHKQLINKAERRFCETTIVKKLATKLSLNEIPSFFFIYSHLS